MDKVLNTDLLKNPFNWVILWLMVAIAYLGLVTIFPSLLEDKGNN